MDTVTIEGNMHEADLVAFSTSTYEVEPLITK